MYGIIMYEEVTNLTRSVIVYNCYYIITIIVIVWWK